MSTRKPLIADYLWIAFAAFVSLGFAVTVVGAIRISLDSGAPGPLIPLPVGAVVVWWLGAGAWRRTRWSAARRRRFRRSSRQP